MERSTFDLWFRARLKFAPAAALVLGTTSEALAYRCPQNPSPPKTETYQGFLGRVKQLDGVELPYRLFVPPNYDANKAYPLVLYLHHAGLAGTDSNNESKWDNCVHLTSEIGSGDDYGGVFTHRAVDEDGNRFDTQERYPHFVLAPHANSPAYGFGGGVAGSATGTEHPTRRLVWAILDDVKGEFNIDPGRLYVTGISMGCYGTWDIIMRSPGVFAAASPQSCRGDPNQTLLAKLKDMPIWSMCGTNDSYFAGAQAMADAMTQVGETAFTFTAMQGVGHSINDRGYDYPGFIDWMFAQHLADVGPGSGGAAGAGGAAAGAGGAAAGASSSMGGDGGVAPQGGAAATAGNGGAGDASSFAGAGAAAVAGAGGNGGASPGGAAGEATASGGAGVGGSSSLGGNAGSAGDGAGMPPGGSAGNPGVASGGGTNAPIAPPDTSERAGCALSTTPSSSASPAAVFLLLLAIARRRRKGRHETRHE
jgi:MYXO-CTERM domain-containing protein